MPIVTMSPAVKLKEGADFAFGARWALVQYHVWSDRREFIDMADAAVKDYFHAWLEQPGCPWYIKEQWEQENSRRLRDVGKAGKGGRRDRSTGTPMSDKTYQEKLHEYIAAENFEAAAELHAAQTKQAAMSELAYEEKLHK